MVEGVVLVPNGDRHMTPLTQQHAGTSYAATSCKPMLSLKMADQLAASWQSGLSVTDVILYFV